MGRSLTVGNVYAKTFKTYKFDGIWRDVFGDIEQNGVILIWGNEKNGKTWFALKFADYLSSFERVLYVSAEEGVSMNLQDTLKRIGVHYGNRCLHLEEYLSIEELDHKISKRQSARIVFVDNMTIYNDELKNGMFRKLVNKHSGKLFIFLAHEERGEPYTATAKLAKKLAKVVIYVEGLRCSVAGRVPGGVLDIDMEKSALYHGQTTKQNED